MSEEFRFEANRSSGEVSALLQRPPDARWLYVFAHGAGAGMRHSFMEHACEDLAVLGVATFRYNFPYMEGGRRAPNPRPILLATVRSAVAAARGAAPDLPVVAGGKSMGGRMTSEAQAKEPIAGIRGLAFFGFPLHPAGRPGTERAEHLARVNVPMLFLQGTRDALADLDLLRPICRDLGVRSTLHEVQHADHSFHVLVRSGRTDVEVRDELASTWASWADGLA